MMMYDALIDVISRVKDSSSSSKLSPSTSYTIPIGDNESVENELVLVELVSERDRTFRLLINGRSFNLSPDIYTHESRRISAADYFFRNFLATVLAMESCGGDVPIVRRKSAQYVLLRSYIDVSSEDGSVTLEFKVLRCSAEQASVFLGISLPSLVNQWLLSSKADSPGCRAHWQCVEDQIKLREMVSKVGVAFVANGSILPRAGGDDDRLLAGTSVVPFSSPATLQAVFHLPHRGIITGMLIPKGVTVITGGGYHGKSTILNAIKVGMYNKVPHDGREFVVTVSSGIAIRSEDGRHVAGVDISPFIDHLPAAANIDPRSFSSSSASGSTSMAANVIESMEFYPELFLLDEDTCASNFMIRDSRMRSMIANEPITPFIYRVNSLHKEKGISTIVVIGGSGDWFDVQDTTIMMDNYHCLDVSKKARSICKTFCTGRVQFNGRGLVHQLPWPLPVERDHEIQSSTSHIPRKRVLSYMKLPCNLEEGGHVTASEDGHSIIFRSLDSRSCSSSDARNGNTIGNKRKNTASTDDMKRTVLISPNETRNPNSHIDMCITIDLSRVEQRIATKEGALGIALAVCFVSIVLNSENVDNTEESTLNNDNHGVELFVVLGRFVNLRKYWRNTVTHDITRKAGGLRPSDSTDSIQRAVREECSLQDITNSRSTERLGDAEFPVVTGTFEIDKNNYSDNHQVESDLLLICSIHEVLLGQQDFLWPSMCEAAAAINRLRGTKFSSF